LGFGYREKKKKGSHGWTNGLILQRARSKVAKARENKGQGEGAKGKQKQRQGA